MKNVIGKSFVAASALAMVVGFGAAAQAGDEHAKDMTGEAVTACALHLAMSDVVPPECKPKAKKRAIETGFLTGEEPPAPAPRAVSRSVALNILFEPNSTELTEDAKRDLKQVGAFLEAKVNAGREFYILGHTDSVGNDDYNMQLSETRANAVADYLMSISDVKDVKITAAGMGETEPFDPENPESEVNRRVEISRVDQ